MNDLDRIGVFRAKPVSWVVKTFKASRSVAIGVEFKIIAQLDESDSWQSWEEFEPHRVFGDFFIVGREGQPNTKTCGRLRDALGWSGNLKLGQVPDVEVRIEVESEVYQGTTRFKVKWLNPLDYMPESFGASPEEVGQLEAQFGSLLRAAAAGSVKKAAPAPKAPPTKKAAPAEPFNPATVDPDQIPF